MRARVRARVRRVRHSTRGGQHQQQQQQQWAGARPSSRPGLPGVAGAWPAGAAQAPGGHQGRRRRRRHPHPLLLPPPPARPRLPPPPPPPRPPPRPPRTWPTSRAGARPAVAVTVVEAGTARKRPAASPRRRCHQRPPAPSAARPAPGPGRPRWRPPPSARGRAWVGSRPGARWTRAPAGSRCGRPGRPGRRGRGWSARLGEREGEERIKCARTAGRPADAGLCACMRVRAHPVFSTFQAGLAGRAADAEAQHGARADNRRRVRRNARVKKREEHAFSHLSLLAPVSTQARDTRTSLPCTSRPSHVERARARVHCARVAGARLTARERQGREDDASPARRPARPPAGERGR